MLDPVESNFMTSMYGRKKFEDYLKTLVASDSILYVDKEKSHELFNGLRVQFPASIESLGFDSIIHESRNAINGKNNRRIIWKQSEQMILSHLRAL